MKEGDVLDTYPWLTAEDIQACLAFMMDPERSAVRVTRSGDGQLSRDACAMDYRDRTTI